MAYISAGNLEPTKNVQPVRFLESDDPLKLPRPGIGLCLSGGGYRAMLFHVGAIWRLNELGLLRKEIVVAGAEAMGPQHLRQERLINWGFAVCDAAIRTHVDPTAPLPAGFPYPAVGVG